MSHPVELSESLVLDARLAGEITERSIASQIEFWARIGRAAEVVLGTDALLRLKQRGETRALSECLESVDTSEGRKRVAAHLASRRYPHFEPAPGRAGFLVKIDEDGIRRVGRFMNREFKTERSR